MDLDQPLTTERSPHVVYFKPYSDNEEDDECFGSSNPKAIKKQKSRTRYHRAASGQTSPNKVNSIATKLSFGQELPN
jgi:hypothetical protein